MRAKEDASMSSMTEIDARVGVSPRTSRPILKSGPLDIETSEKRGQEQGVPSASQARLPWTRVFEFLAGHGSLPSRALVN